MKEFFKKTWAWLEGNKTIIGGLLLYANTKWGSKLVGVDIAPIIEYAILLLTGIAGYHHYTKGFFTTKKGN